MTTRGQAAVRAQHNNNGDEGGALLLVVMISFVIAILGATMVTRATQETRLSGFELERQGAIQAAEAGVNDYVAKMTEDHLYFKHYVHPAETSRKNSSTNAVVNANTTAVTWPGDPWTYPTPHNRWKALTNGYEFNLQITSPSAADPRTTILASGRKTGSARTTRSIEVVIRGSSVADFQMFAASDVNVGSGADTYGRYYAGVDAGGTKHSISYDGNAYADVIAENVVTTPTGTLASHLANATARMIDKNTANNLLRTVIGAPPQFGSFSTAFAEVKRAAQSTTGGGPFLLDDSTQDGWFLNFKPAGTIDVYKCKKKPTFLLYDGNKDGSQRPVCTLFVANKPVPAIGAIWVQQSVIVAGTVKGRVTVATQGDVVIGDPVSATTVTNFGDLLYAGTDDVIGLMAYTDVVMPTWSPPDLEVHAALLAQTGRRYGRGPNDSRVQFTHYGATASSLTPSMSMFTNRDYNYDPNLLFIQPPFFPVLEKAYTVLRYREVNG